MANVDSSAFERCENLALTEWPSSVTSVSDFVFGLSTFTSTSLTLPNTLTSIGDDAFAGAQIEELIFTGSTAPTFVAYDPFTDETDEAGMRIGTIYVPATGTGYTAENDWPVENIKYLYDVTVKAEGDGTASADKTAMVKQGKDTVTLTATPPEGCHVVGQAPDGITISDDKFIIPDDYEGTEVTITAVFEAHTPDENDAPTYTAEGGTITATCSDCKAELGTATISATDKTYDGTAVTVNVAKTGTLTNTDIAVTYAVKDGATLESAPVNAGEYTVSITYGNETASVDFTISPKSITPTIVGSATKTYDGTNTVPEGHALSIVADGILGSDAVELTATYIYGGVGAGTTTITATDITLTGEDSGNYTLTQTTVSASVGKITKEVAVISVATETYNKIYGDADFTLDVSDDNPEADVTYTSSDEDVVTVSNGTVTIQGAGEATITVSLAESTNYNAAEDKTITLTVNKAKNVPNMPGSSMKVSNKYTKVGDVPLPDGWEWQDAYKETALEVDTPVTAMAVYTGTDKDNYENITISISVTRNTCDHVAGDILYTGEGEKEPTCTESGLGHKECTKCNTFMESGIVANALGHTGGTATCKDQAVCTRCNQPYGSINGSRHGDTEVRGYRAATCTSGGYTGDTYCKDCGTKLSSGNTANKLGHNYESEVTKQPTTTEEGLRTYTCSRCGDSYTETIPATGETGSDQPDSGQPGSGETNSGQTEQAAKETQILSQENDKDIQGSTFATLSLRMSKATKNSIKLKWNKVKGADGYVVYGAMCNSNGKINKLEKLSDTTKTTFTHKKLTKGTYYKYVVRAYKVVDGVETTISTSKTLHINTSGGKYANYTSVKVPKTKVTIKKGKKYTIKATAVLKKGKKAKSHKKLSYESSNTSIATVTSKGVIKAKKKGTCYIYVYAQNGVYKKIKVTVK